MRKKPRKKTDPLDEDTMVALALSSSMLEQEREAGRELQTEIAASHTSMAPELKWRPDAGTAESPYHLFINSKRGFRINQ